MREQTFIYRLKFEAPVGIFTGLGIAGFLDRTVLRDANRLPYVPGSTVKGRLRFFAERVLRSSSTDDIRLHDDTAPYCKRVEQACTVCRLFGNPAISGRLRFGAATPSPPWNQLLQDVVQSAPNPVWSADSEVRTGIALSRLRRTALQDHMFIDEVIPALPFEGLLSIADREHAKSEMNQQEVRWLFGLARLVDALGARKAAGRGRLQAGIEIEKAVMA